jgi:hypothetical protein
VISNTNFFERLTEDKLNIPTPDKISNTQRVLPYVFVGDEAFAMRPDFLKPYSRDQLNTETKIFNYRMSRARRVIENTFGIMGSRFRLLQRVINLDVENIDIVVMACCVMHNFLRKTCPQHYIAPETLDR